MKFAFTHVEKETFIVEAIDGHTAWNELLKEKTKHDLRGYGIQIVCDCGEISPYRFCSKDCYEKSGLPLLGSC